MRIKVTPQTLKIRALWEAIRTLPLTFRISYLRFYNAMMEKYNNGKITGW